MGKHARILRANYAMGVAEELLTLRSYREDPILLDKRIAVLEEKFEKMLARKSESKKEAVSD